MDFLISSFNDYKKIIVYKTTLMKNLLLHNNDQFPWWNKISKHIILGALPLHNYGHDYDLYENLNVRFVLSIVDDFEISTDTTFSNPVKSNQWKALNVKQQIINSPDFQEINCETINKAVDFLEESIKLIKDKQRQESVYIHCKGGKGRSAAILMCYLLKNTNANYNQVYQFIKTRRSVINLNKGQRDCVMNYYLNLNRIEQ